MTSPHHILELLRRSLNRGETVEVEGLGTFRPLGAGQYDFVALTRPRVFIAYVHEDLEAARRLYEDLDQAGCAPWLDKEKLLPGQNWPRAIERAIENADAFVPCFSPRSIAKPGQFQSELRHALDCARRRPLDSVFLVPVRFEPCAVPRRITDQVQYVDLFPHWSKAVAKLVRSVRRTTRQPPYLKSSI